jgi:hypothetical protein
MEVNFKMWLAFKSYLEELSNADRVFASVGAEHLMLQRVRLLQRHRGFDLEIN